MNRPLFDSPTPQMPRSSPVWLEYGNDEELAGEREAILAVVRFGGERVLEGERFPVLELPVRPLSENAVEIWRSPRPVESGERGGIQWAANGKVLFALVVAAEDRGLEAAASSTYDELLSAAREAGYPHLLRAWNYLAEINTEERGLERYRSFCSGRHEALARHGFAFDQDLPAASAVGHHGETLSVALLASRQPGFQLENPRQVSAWSYPRRYGPRSPSFARATLVRWADEWQLYVAGTASVVGHESRHPGNVKKQLEETLRNLEAIEAEARARAADSGEEIVPLSSRLRVYVRNADDASAISARLRESFGVETPILMLEADICRRELLLEIELIRRFQASP